MVSPDSLSDDLARKTVAFETPKSEGYAHVRHLTPHRTANKVAVSSDCYPLFEMLKAVCVIRFFDHQTYHRGKIHAMLASVGAKPKSNDNLAMT